MVYCCLGLKQDSQSQYLSQLFFFLFKILSHNEFCVVKSSHETEFCLPKINLKQLLLAETFPLQEKKLSLTFHLATNFMNINSSKVVVLLSGSTVRPQVERFYQCVSQNEYNHFVPHSNIEIFIYFLLGGKPKKTSKFK